METKKAKTARIKEVKQRVRNSVKLSILTQHQPGGQFTSPVFLRQRLYSEELDLVIETGYHINNKKNIALLSKLFETAIDELIV